ncbi:RNA polymerase sigma factor [Mangrovibacterium lignilyticum]|uniref:RNA polymerase sigma factor n=1 Tax=Mangrovibacterium lignilyticum TaxID=2668052 RepID=UPI0013D7E3E5|nr:RNA polymerase sigma-70 factor [Mangrovibacterium lignilyticum]
MKDNKTGIDESVVKRFTLGDMQAFDEIYSLFNYKLQKFIFSLVKNTTDTEDLVHEVFVKVWENREKLKAHSAFNSYLFTIGYNTTISFLRRRVHDTRYVEYVKSVQVETDDVDLVEQLDTEEMKEMLNNLIEKMPKRQREVFKMKHFKNSSYKEIAEALNISVNTVENHIVKAHRFLKEHLGKSYLAMLFFIDLFL